MDEKNVRNVRMKSTPYWFSRSLCFNLETASRAPWYGSFIWFILVWPLYAFCGWMIFAGLGLMNNDHQINRTELYSGQFAEEREHLNLMKIQGREDITQNDTDQKQLRDNPDHQIH